MRGRELTKVVKLCDGNGDLNSNSIGWARHPIVYCNVQGSFLRKKKWNYWCMTSPDALFSITVSHLDYAAVIFVYVFDLKTMKFNEQSVLIPFGRHVDMPDNVHDPIYVEHKGIRVSLQDTNINVYWPNFYESKPLQAQFSIKKEPEQESLNVVIPWGKNQFQFTSKQVGLPVQGKVNWSQGEYVFNSNQSFATLDFGRGKWPYRSTWNWGAASGYSDNHKVGLNLGGQWTEGTGQTENGITIDHRLHKVHDELDWIYDQQNYMKPWIIQTPNSHQVKLMFEPIFERVSRTNALIIQSEVHQMFGYYHGTIETDLGHSIEVNKIFGWAEDHKARW